MKPDKNPTSVILERWPNMRGIDFSILNQGFKMVVAVGLEPTTSRM